ncbi:unnamed protein product [Linum tenue]|uniref:RNase H type-1 domain-containing protein n=1 Tax=Linum tenue TaxID=586396 RepID=A0AAV0I0R0_9ROSI|nr:unnamed protein product [Linum tenue]
MLMGRMGETSWRHVIRNGNAAAHIMAHSNTRVDARSVWLDMPPVFLIDQLALDNVTTNFDIRSSYRFP